MSTGTSEPADRSITESIESMRRGEMSAVELLRSTFARLDHSEPRLHAFSHVAREGALASATASDGLRAKGGWAGPLHGIPIAVKDLFNTCDMPTEAGSRVLAGNRPAKDAAAVTRLREAGAVLVGKTITHEFSYGLNEPPTRNSWDVTRYPGGSSAGSAVAVAVGSAAGSIGTDNAGSVRTPASVNGIVGLKPTYGSISTEGVIPTCPSLDHVGPLARTVGDCLILFEVLAGEAPGSVRSRSAKPGKKPLDGMRLGVDRHYFFDSGVETDVAAAVDAALAVMKQAGASIVEIAIPELELATAVTNTIMVVEASRWHRRLLRTQRSDYHPRTRVMLEVGELVPASGYVDAMRARELIREAVKAAFVSEALDAIVAPSTPVKAPPIERATELGGLVHHQCPANLTGQPSLSIPCGISREGLPIGLQIIGRPFAEGTVVAIAAAYEEAAGWHRMRPPYAN
jgi:Asp-tRNA(Asn)/Glu-tRNA(Gln) amidotransferase A subunit family amidase